MSIPLNSGICFSSHGDVNTITEDLFDEDFTAFQKSDGTYRNRSVIIPIILKGCFVDDTENLFNFNIYWRNGTTDYFRSHFVISCDKTNNAYKIVTKSREYNGQPGTDGDATFTINKENAVVFLQSHLASESDTSFTLSTFVHQGFNARNFSGAASCSNTSYSQVNNVLIRIVSYCINDEPAIISIARPFLFDRFDGTITNFGYPRNFYTRSTGGVSIAPENHSAEWIIDADKGNVIPSDWHDSLIVDGINIIDTVVDDIVVDISSVQDVVDDIDGYMGDDDAEPESEDDCKLLCKMRRMFKIKFFEVAFDNFKTYYESNPVRGTKAHFDAIADGIWQSISDKYRTTIENIIKRALGES
jgi:hypothetical protein